MSKTALVVDDSTSMRQMVVFTLQTAGFETIEGANGVEALSVSENTPVDLVITDLNMPEMDGITLIKELRNRPSFKFTPILLLTTESQDNKKQEGKAAGATGWMVKPFNPDQLLAIVKKVVK
jgi:two-component system, chemotaxis family, chemotaxis protein CheY